MFGQTRPIKSFPGSEDSLSGTSTVVWQRHSDISWEISWSLGMNIVHFNASLLLAVYVQYTHAIRSITDVTDKIYAKHSQYPFLESTLVKLTSGRAHDGMPAADSIGLPLLGRLALHLHQS